MTKYTHLANFTTETRNGHLFDSNMSLNNNIADIDDWKEDDIDAMWDTAVAYVESVWDAIYEILKGEIEIGYFEKSRKSQSIYFYAELDGIEKKIRFSDHTDHGCNADLNLWWGACPHAMAAEISELFRKDV